MSIRGHRTPRKEADTLPGFEPWQRRVGVEGQRSAAPGQQLVAAEPTSVPGHRAASA